MANLFGTGGGRGTVFLTEFDRGMVEATGAELFKTGTAADGSDIEEYFAKIDGVTPAPGQPGVQLIFAAPEDKYTQYTIPSIVVRRVGMDPALQRWHPGSESYRLPAPGAVVTQVDGTVGVDKVETKPQGVPYDINYEVEIRGRYQNSLSVGSTRMLQHVMKRIQPYFYITVEDSEGDVRQYDAFAGSIGSLDKLTSVQNRLAGFSIPVRVEGELDVNDPVVGRTVQRRMFNMRRV